MVYRLILIAILCCSCTKMEIATNTLLVADWAQTRQIAKNSDLYYERTNVILGKHPSVDKVDGYHVAVITLNTILHRKWPWPRVEKFRSKLLPYYQYGLIAVEVGCIQNSYNIGLQVKF